MKRLLNYCLAVLLVTTGCVGCRKEGIQYDLQPGRFGSSETLEANVSSVILSTDNQEDSVLKLNWSAASFGEGTVVTYSLQFTTASDTAAGWSHARMLAVGSNSGGLGFLGKDLNTQLTEMGVSTGVVNRIVFRVRADVNQYNGTTSTVQPAWSNPVGIDITSFALSLFIPGDFQGWDPGSAPALNPVAGRMGMFEGYVYMADPGQHYFKYTNARDWNHTNYGDGGNGTFSTDGAAAGLSVPEGGYYELTADLNTNKWTAVKTNWGIIGDASPGGWNTDTPMTYDPASQTWKVTLNMIQAGSWKFRANGGWDINFGISNDGKIAYADNPFFGSVQGLNNLTVPSDGNYTITLDLHVSGVYNFDVHKN